MRLAEDKADWVVGFEDECWWSRAAQPNLHSFSEEKASPCLWSSSRSQRTILNPKAISCYGLCICPNSNGVVGLGLWTVAR
jgi:hypothetical protein